METEELNSQTNALYFQLILVGFLMYGLVYEAHVIAAGYGR